jgi:threonine dehydrogenase-like Zn-dependent dehydrogenase
VKKLFAKDGRAVVVDVPEPDLRPGEVLIAPAYSAISTGTETSTIRMSSDAEMIHSHDYPAPDGRVFGPKLRSSGARWNGPLPRGGIPGHALIGYSVAGRVLAVGDDVTDLRPGDRVAASGSQAAHHAEIVAVPRNLVAPVPDAVDLADAAFITLGTISMHSVRLTEATFGGTIVVYGLGLLGLLALQIARSAGIYTVGIDTDERRLELARRWGARATVDPRTADARAAVEAATDGFGADGVILGVVSQSDEPLNHAFELCRHRATVVGLGAFGTRITRDAMVWNDVRLVMVLAYGPGRYDPVYEEGNVDYPIGYARWTENRNQQHFLRLLAEGQVEVGPLAPIRVPFGEGAPAAYDILKGPDRPATVVFDYGRGEL